MKKWPNLFLVAALSVGILFVTAAAQSPAPMRQAVDPNPPDRVVKLIFIHHSTGENWLTDGYGNLGQALGRNNYFVSDTNYGWGPNAIGDRTDIPDWIEWFASANTSTYLSALFHENGQNASYTRTLADPGGENTIIMFKSCFPNSALEGNPNDPPGAYGELSVKGAKYVYNTILRTFAQHPDKLFVVITAPPLSDATYAANARAFNNWLVNDWLRENNYTLNNVAVFDFYNILTDKNAHHRVNNGQVEHLLGRRDTLAYPSGDDHPSEAGSRKATEEFVPMLNAFYHRWEETASLPPAQPGPVEAPGAGTQPNVQPGAAAGGVVDSFESGTVPGTTGWEAFRDDATSSTMACAVESGTGRAGNSLRLDYNIAANSWGTCALFYDVPQNWSAGQGLSFFYRAAQAGQLFDIDLYAGPSGSRETYLFTVEAAPESVNGWVQVDLRWEDFRRASWEEDAGAPFAKSSEVAGMAFGLGTLPDAPNSGTFWVDDVTVLGTAPQSPPDVAPPSDVQPEPPAPAEPSRQRLLNCGGGLILPFALAGLVAWRRKRK